MSIIKSFSVGEGDMFYILHNSNSFTVIDCSIDETYKEQIVNEILEKREGRRITRFISTHPDEDHIHGLKFLDSKLEMLNFYCVENSATKSNETDDFKYYCNLRDGEHHYYVYKGCKRRWLNVSDGDIKSAGINFLWPITDNEDYKKAIENVANGSDFNNISPVFTYSMSRGVTMLWMGDMEHTFLEKSRMRLSGLK